MEHSEQSIRSEASASAATFGHAWDRPYYPASGEERCYLLVEANGGDERVADRAPINVSLVLDRSASMTGLPLAYCKEACRFVVDRMNGNDRLSLVAFDDRAETIIAPGPVRDKAELKRLIGQIDNGSRTNLGAGLIEGANHVLRGKDEDPRAVNRVVVLSDGHANRGITSKLRLAEIAEEYGSSGISVSAMGVGDGFDEELMETLSGHGNGNFYYMDTPERIPVIFQKELEGMLSVVADRMTLKLRPAEGVQVVGVRGYPVEYRAGAAQVRAGDLYGNEKKPILIELALGAREPGSHPVLTLDWTYRDLTRNGAASAYSCEVEATFTDDESMLGMPGEPKVLREIAYTRSAVALESAIEAMDRGDAEEGRRVLREQADRLRSMSDVLDDPELKDAAEMLRAGADSTAAYTNRARKELHERKVSFLRRRS